MMMKKTPPLVLIGCLFFAALSASAQTLPKIKAGLWESTNIPDDKTMPQTKTQMCLNDDVMAQMLKMGQGMVQGMCSKQEFSMRGNTAVGSVECKFGTSKMRSNSVTIFSSDTAYRTESKATFDPPMLGMKESKTIVDAKHIGACGTMKPGDMMINGKKMNVLEMTKAAGK